VRFVLIALAAVVMAAASTVPAAVAAETEISRLSVTFSTVVGDNPCTEEPVVVEGTLVILSRTTVGETGNLSSSILLLLRDVTAVGVETGASYVYRSVTGSSFTLQQGTSVTDTSTLVLVRPGSGGNLLVRLVFHETLAATGEVTALVENGGATCTG
jgi:hypothetical protein